MLISCIYSTLLYAEYISGKEMLCLVKMRKLIVSSIGIFQNVMPLSAGLFKSEHKNPVSQCPPRLHVQFLTHVLWSRVPNHFLKVDVSRISERQGWMIQCLNPLQFMALHIPEENRLMFVLYCTRVMLGL